MSRQVRVRLDVPVGLYEFWTLESDLTGFRTFVTKLNISLPVIFVVFIIQLQDIKVTVR